MKDKSSTTISGARAKQAMQFRKKVAIRSFLRKNLGEQKPYNVEIELPDLKTAKKSIAIFKKILSLPKSREAAEFINQFEKINFKLIGPETELIADYLEKLNYTIYNLNNEYVYASKASRRLC